MRLADGHNVYLHCRAGIGRSALAAGCWLAEKRGSTAAADAELNELWQQSAQSRYWARVPETEAQIAYLARWLGAADSPVTPSPARADASPAADALRGAWYGLALGDALAATRSTGTAGPRLDATDGADAVPGTQPARTCGASMRVTRSSVMCAGSARVTVRRTARRANRTQPPMWRRRWRRISGASSPWPGHTTRRTPQRRVCRACSRSRRMRRPILRRRSTWPQRARAPPTNRRSCSMRAVCLRPW